ncbi:hypothetical protein BH11PSE12_BH11PSE12_00370 [soil metagenome]
MSQKLCLNSLTKLRKEKKLLLASLVSVCCVAMAQSEPAAGDTVQSMRDKYSAITPQLKQNQFSRPLVLESEEAESQLRGDVYAVVDYPLSVVNAGLNNPEHWCDVMLLHINTKYCHAMVAPEATTLRMYLGKKTPEELSHTTRLNFNYKQVVANAELMQISLTAADGPLGTSDYHIVLSALALSKGKTFLHLTYSYASSLTGRLAMQTYLATLAHNKVGFTKVAQQANGQSSYIGGVRGLMERNTMRYYLAIDSYLATANAPPDQQLEKRLQHWYTSAERYPRQLHDVERNDYLEMKRAEYSRQQEVH